ncbi:MAG: hypothetical protein FJ255_02115 [Phycisphaerae bacterium]|nr:hypothetical protein [Phycisphaerae bacterium]
MTQTTDTGGGRWASLGAAARAVGLAPCVVVPGLLALTTYDPFPGWGTDPAILPSPIMGIGPAGLTQSGVIMVLGLAVYVLGCAVDGRRFSLWQFVLFVVGAAAAFGHVAVRQTITVENIALGSAWTGAMAAGLTVAHAGGDPTCRRLIAAALAGVVAAMVVKGGVQVLVEHPNTVAEYRATREAFLASQGWEPGSAMAAAFERRLFQPEATGWFGLANVYSTFAAWGVVFAAGLTAGAWSDRSARGLAWIGVVLLAAIAGLAMGGAKGGYAAAVGGVAIVALAWRRRSRAGAGPGSWPLVVGLGAVAAPLAAVWLRGLVGERVGELSLLFRWFYMEGAARIIVEHPLMGVGPAGFKDAYLLAKPALSPEEVTSPHSVLFDWVACLGVGGLAWVALLGAWALRAGRNALASGASPDGSPARDDRAESRLRVALLAGWAVVVLFAVGQESGGVGPEALLARVAGAAAGIGVGMWVLRGRAPLTWVVAPAALAVIAHAQVEMTAAHPTAAALLMVAIGLGAGSVAGPRRDRAPTWPAALGAALLVGAVNAMQVRAVEVRRWQAGVESASRLIAEPTDLLRRLSLAGGPGGEPVSAVVRDAQALGPSAPSEPRRLAEWVDAERTRRLGAARGMMVNRLSRQTIDHFETLRAASRLALIESRAAAATGESPHSMHLRTEASSTAVTGTELFPASSQAWAWLATVRAEAGGGASVIGALQRAAALDPHGLTIKVRLADACAKAGLSIEAEAWAWRALEADRNLRLDPLRRLSDLERARLERMASPAGPDNGPGA